MRASLPVYNKVCTLIAINKKTSLYHNSVQFKKRECWEGHEYEGKPVQLTATFQKHPQIVGIPQPAQLFEITFWPVKPLNNHTLANISLIKINVKPGLLMGNLINSLFKLRKCIIHLFLQCKEVYPVDLLLLYRTAPAIRIVQTHSGDMHTFCLEVGFLYSNNLWSVISHLYQMWCNWKPDWVYLDHVNIN